MGLIERLTRSPHIHDDVAGRFQRYFTSGRILDVPAGDGVNSRRLAEAGFEVRAADLFPEECRGRNIECDRVDMTGPLPYPEDSFDGVLHSEGIEHVDNQIALLERLCRIIKPGGILIVTTPNVLHLEGRLGLMLTGHAHRRRAMVVGSAGYWSESRRNEAGAMEHYFGHVFLINAYQLRFYLTHAGFEVLEVDTTRYSPRSLLLAPLLWFPVYVSTSRMLRGGKSKVPPELRRRIRREVLGGAVLFGRKLIMTARKPAPSAGSRAAP